jgi:hypothetical protein
MFIEIIDDQKYIGKNIKPGKYEIESLELGTYQQLKTIYALINCYWLSNCHSYNSKDVGEFKEDLKSDLGAGAVPHQTKVDPDTGKKLSKPRIVFENKSLSKYNKKERMQFIDSLITQMNMVNVDTPKYREILQGLML